MIRRAFFLSTAALGLCAFAAAQTPTNVNWKPFYNDGQTDAVTRHTGGVNDTMFQMYPVEHLRTASKVHGWLVIMQDQDYQTPEPTNFGIVKFQNDGKTPDNSATGVIVSATVNLPFPKPASGTRSATDWLITLNNTYDCGERHGMRLIIGNASVGTPTPTDGVYVFTQTGTSLKLPPSVTPDTWTFGLSTQNQIVPHFQPGTTMWMSPTYVMPVIRNMTNSTAYGQPEDLFGPEALTPDTARGDKVAWEVYGDTYANQVAVLLISGSLLPTPIDTPLGRFYMTPPFGLINVALLLDQYGVGASTPLNAPAGLKLYAQAAFINTVTFGIEMTDLVEVNTK